MPELLTTGALRTQLRAAAEARAARQGEAATQLAAAQGRAELVLAVRVAVLRRPEAVREALPAGLKGALAVEPEARVVLAAAATSA